MVTSGIIMLLAIIGIVSGGPLHASCKVTWTFGDKVTCAQVNAAIIKQIQTWTPADNCKDGGEKCLYKLKSSSDTEIKATHETPKKHYIDDLEFTFESGINSINGACTVKGSSSSETWYAILDYGTNYCNLHNLITGAGIDKLPGYKEETSNSVCTQYSSADCEKY